MKDAVLSCKWKVLGSKIVVSALKHDVLESKYQVFESKQQVLVIKDAICIPQKKKRKPISPILSWIFQRRKTIFDILKPILDISKPTPDILTTKHHKSMQKMNILMPILVFLITGSHFFLKRHDLFTKN